MKTRDSEALQHVLESGLWKIDYETGDILTRRDRHGRDTDPPVWRSATFKSPSRNSSTRKRIWVNGRRVYANRVAWVLHHREMIPEGYQVDHIDDNSLNDLPNNLQLLDGEGNRVKELANGRVHRFQSFSKTGDGEFPFFTTGYILTEEQRTRPEGAWEAINRVATVGNVSDYIGPHEAEAIRRGLPPLQPEPTVWYCIDGNVCVEADDADIKYVREIHPGVVQMVSDWYQGAGAGLGDWSFVGPKLHQMHVSVGGEWRELPYKGSISQPIDWRISLARDIKRAWTVILERLQAGLRKLLGRVWWGL